DFLGILQELVGVVERRQRVADFVREAGGEPAQGVEGQRLGPARDQRGVVQEHQRALAVAQQAGKAWQHLALLAAQAQRRVLALAAGPPLATALGPWPAPLRQGPAGAAPAP